MIPVILETPYGGSGELPLQLRYLRACIRDCLLRHESPFSWAHLYAAPGVLRPDYLAERALSLSAKLAWREFADRTVLYSDFGWSEEMLIARDSCTRGGWRYEVRFLGSGWLIEQLAREAQGEALGDWLRSFGKG